MEIRYEEKDELQFIGFTETVRTLDSYEKCPILWSDYLKLFDRLLKDRNPSNSLEKAVLDNDIGTHAISLNRKETFEYTICGFYKGGEVPEGLNVIKYHACKWAIFSTKGPLPKSIHHLNDYIWNEWLPNEGATLGANPIINVEWYSIGNAYSKDYECGIWVPIATIPEGK